MCSLTKAEERVYKNIKQSLEQIKLHQEGQADLCDARELLKNYSAKTTPIKFKFSYTTPVQLVNRF
jgi:hypothetical protein